jgi:hypothetical protein
MRKNIGEDANIGRDIQCLVKRVASHYNNLLRRCEYFLYFLNGACHDELLVNIPALKCYRALFYNVICCKKSN